ncbi:augurin-A [Clupea harengus]|uniref:Augurin-A n=1 Tax=Clupea harengus TaxID=7950 RepID=A0A6P8G5T2_CLUHA|nr:augurin-A [Clupea harengus]
MASLSFCLRLLAITALMATLALTDASSEDVLKRILKKREVAGSEMPSSSVVMPSSKAMQFLAALKRPKRNLWDRSRPDVQQWIQQFMLMGYDEARLETDLAYWKDQSQANDQGRQHHYDENAALGPRSATGYRHGANVNYDYY